MLEIWINGNSIKSCPSLVRIEGRKIVQLDGFKNARKLDVGINDELPQ